MFKELTDELLDLTVSEKGFGNALYAAVDNDDGCGGAGSCSCSWSLCCTI